MSPLPAALIPVLTVAASLASAGAGIYSAVSKPDTPDQPKAIPNAGALQADRRRAAAATGGRGNILTSQKLGSVGA